MVDEDVIDDPSTTEQVTAQRMSRAAEMRPSSYNEADRTLDVVWSTGAAVMRFDWWDGEFYSEELSMKPDAVRLERLNAGAALLDTHDSWQLRSVIGSVVPGSARIEAGTYLVNSPTVTSDATEKEWLGAGFSSAELSAAKRISAEIGSYKWLAAIARENDGGPAARVHFGVRAQAVWAIMADEGLIDPIEEGVTPSCPYGFLCWDAVEDNPNGRFGIRIEQLAMFLIAAQEARLTALEALITEGE